MVSMDEDNYKEAVEATFKVFAPRGISEYTSSVSLQYMFGYNETGSVF